MIKNDTKERFPRTAVVIPNYNGLKFMEVCIKALYGQSLKDFYIIIVDNGSTDGSAEYIKEMQKEAAPVRTEAILLPENTGFSGAVNEGIRRASENASEFVVLLNNDTEAESSYIEALVKEIERDERIFSVSPLMLQYHNRELIDDAGDGYNLLGWAFQRGVGHSASEKEYGKRREIFTACAGAAIYRTELLESLRLKDGEYFDLMHFAYLEDIDIGYRARINGYKNIYCPDSRIYHIGSGTSGSKYNPFKVKLAARNNIYLNYKNMPLLQLLINLPGIVSGILIKTLFFYRKGFLKDYAAGLSEGLRTLKRARKVKFRFKNLLNYIFIEGLLIRDTFVYAAEFIKRKL